MDRAQLTPHTDLTSENQLESFQYVTRGGTEFAWSGRRWNAVRFDGNRLVNGLDYWVPEDEIQDEQFALGTTASTFRALAYVPCP